MLVPGPAQPRVSIPLTRSFRGPGSGVCPYRQAFSFDIIDYLWSPWRRLAFTGNLDSCPDRTSRRAGCQLSQSQSKARRQETTFPATVSHHIVLLQLQPTNILYDVCERNLFRIHRLIGRQNSFMQTSDWLKCIFITVYVDVTFVAWCFNIQCDGCTCVQVGTCPTVDLLSVSKSKRSYINYLFGGVSKFRTRCTR